MTPTAVHTFFFSPTGTSRKIAEAVAQGAAAEAGALPTQSAPIVRNDFTHSKPTPASLDATTLAVIAVPVYGGKIAPEARIRMDRIAGKGTPAILLVVYGNRDIGRAAVELAEFATTHGFIPVAAGAFIGEHSYATAQYPIATGRPDTQDLAAATAFGAAVRKKIAATPVTPINAAQLKAPSTPLLSQLRFIRFAIGYMWRQKRHPAIYLPTCDADRCTHCGKCAAVCPTTAISRGDECSTDSARCIRCCACVKACPTMARTFHSPFAEALSSNFNRRKMPVVLL